MRKHLLPFLHRRGRNYYFFHTDELGRRREESLRTPDPEEAHRWYLQRMSEINTGTSTSNEVFCTGLNTEGTGLQLC